MRKRVVVTGAGGYIGRHVVAALANRDTDVVAVDRVEPEVDSRAETMIADIFDGRPDWYALFGEPDVVLHMAWRNGFMHNADSHITDLPTHYEFEKNLIESGLKHLAVMGSMHEVGYYEGAITEDTPCNPGSLYGISKNALRRATEMLCAQTGSIFQWIRAYYIVGDDRHNNSIFAKLLEAHESGQKDFPFTSGKNLYDFISVQELAEQIAAIVLQNDVNGVINACTGEPMSLADRVESYIDENGLNLTLKYGAFPDRAYDSPAVWGDNTKIRKIMGTERRSVSN